MKVISVVGARPQFVKAATVVRAAKSRGVEHRLIHTGQHYDAQMSDVFFEELAMPAPEHHLGVGSASHAVQTAEIMKRLEPVLLEEKPDWVLLYGDTNSTFAGAAVASKIHQRVAHVEAGLRSFNRAMPEEINRIATDHLSDLLLCPTETAMRHLEREGLGSRARLTGDVMYDAVLFSRAGAEAAAPELAAEYPAGSFALATVHRAENTDNPARLEGIREALEQVAREICPVVLPLHPRTAQVLAARGRAFEKVRVIPPVGYHAMLLLESRARLILTDSGGVQKEAYFFQVPCVTMRDETEWVETLSGGCNQLAGADAARILAAAKRNGAGPWTAAYGNGQAAEAILQALQDGMIMR